MNYRLSNTCGQRPDVADFERVEAYGQISRQFVFKLASSLRGGASTPNLNCKNGVELNNNTKEARKATVNMVVA